MSFRIENQNFLTTPTARIEISPTIVSAGLSDTPSVLTSSSISSVSFLNFFSNCFSKVKEWLQRLFCTRTPAPVTQPAPQLIDQLKAIGRNMITGHFQPSNISQITRPSFKAATIIKLEDSIIACHYDDVTRQSLENFRNISIHKMEEALERVTLTTNSKLSIETIFVENCERNGVKVHTQHNWSQNGNGGGASGHTGVMNLVSAARILHSDFDGNSNNASFRDPVIRFLLARS